MLRAVGSKAAEPCHRALRAARLTPYLGSEVMAILASAWAHLSFPFSVLFSRYRASRALAPP